MHSENKTKKNQNILEVFWQWCYCTASAKNRSFAVDAVQRALRESPGGRVGLHATLHGGDGGYLWAGTGGGEEEDELPEADLPVHPQTPGRHQQREVGSAERKCCHSQCVFSKSSVFFKVQASKSTSCKKKAWILFKKSGVLFKTTTITILQLQYKLNLISNEVYFHINICIYSTDLVRHSCAFKATLAFNLNI